MPALNARLDYLVALATFPKYSSISVVKRPIRARFSIDLAVTRNRKTASCYPVPRPSRIEFDGHHPARHRPHHETAAPVLPAGNLARDHIAMTYVTTKDGTQIFYKDWI